MKQTQGLMQMRYQKQMSVFLNIVRKNRTLLLAKLSSFPKKHINEKSLANIVSNRI